MQLFIQNIRIPEKLKKPKIGFKNSVPYLPIKLLHIQWFHLGYWKYSSLIFKVTSLHAISIEYQLYPEAGWTEATRTKEWHVFT